MYEQALNDSEVIDWDPACSGKVGPMRNPTSVGLGEAFGKFKGMFGQAVSYVKDQT